MQENDETMEIEAKKLIDTDTEDEYEKENKAKFQTLLGLVLAVSSTLVILASTVCVQLLERRIPDFELNTFRCATVLMFSLAGLIVKTTWPTIPRDLILSTLMYTLLNYAMAITKFIAVTLLPVATVQSVIYTTRITTGVILFALFLEERVTVQRVVSAAVCISGVILVIQPEFLFPQEQLTGVTTNLTPNLTLYQDDETMATTAGVTKVTSFPLVVLGYVLSVISGFTCPLDILLLKKIPSLKEHMFAVLFWCFILSILLSVVPMTIFENLVLPSNWYDAIYVVIHCVGFFLFWPLYVYSVPLISANVNNLIWSLNVVFLLLAQYTILSSILPGHRNWIEVTGVFLVILGSVMGSIIEMIKSKESVLCHEILCSLLQQPSCHHTRTCVIP